MKGSPAGHKMENYGFPTLMECPKTCLINCLMTISEYLFLPVETMISLLLFTWRGTLCQGAQKIFIKAYRRNRQTKTKRTYFS